MSNELNIFDEENSDAIDADEKPTDSQKPKVQDKKGGNKELILGCVFIGILFAAFVMGIVLKGKKPAQTHVEAPEDTITTLQPSQASTQQIRDELDTYNQIVRSSDKIAYEKTLPTDRPTYGSGCSESDTICQREMGIIDSNECAVKDTFCNSYMQDRLQVQNVEPANNDVEKPYVKDENFSEVITSTLANSQDYSLVLEDLLDSSSQNQEISTEQTAPQIIDSNVSQNSTSTDKLEVRVIQEAGSRVIATAEIALNSDFSKTAAVSVFGGNIGEALSVGTAEKAPDGNYMRLSFKKLTFKNGVECEINAVALDPVTTYDVVRSSVDHHYISRFGWWGLGVIAKAAAVYEAARMSHRDQIYVGGQNIVVDSTDYEARRQIAQSVTQLGNDVGAQLMKSISKPSTVYVDVNEEMGFFFLERLTTEDCK